MGTVVIDVKKRWDLDDREDLNKLNFNSTGLCPVGRGILDHEKFPGESWLNMTCAKSDPLTGNNKRTEFKFADDGDPRLVGNRFYYIETFFEDYTPDSSSPSSCNHSFLQWKFGDDYPQLAPWVENIGGVLKIRLNRQYSAAVGLKTPQTIVPRVQIVNLTSNLKQGWLWDILWRGDATGHVKLYLDGTQVLNLTGIQTMDTGSTTPPPRVGPYCFGSFNSIVSRTIFFHRFIVANDDFGTAEDFLSWLQAQDETPPATNTLKGKRFKNI